MDTHYKIYLYKPSGLDTDFLGELLVDNLNAQIKLHDISTISFTIPEAINGVANPRLDQVLDSYIVELRYGKNITNESNYPSDYSKIRFTIYSTPLDYSDHIRTYSYSGYSLESLLEFKHITNWGGIEVKDFFRTVTYNNNAGETEKFTETGSFNYTISTSTNARATKYITVLPTTTIATPLDIFIYEVRKNTSPASENQGEYIRFSGSGVNDENFRQGYYYLNITNGYITSINIALPENYNLFNLSATKTLFFKLYDNPLSRYFAIGVNRNDESPFTNMYIELAHDANLGDDTPEYNGYSFNSQSIYSKNGLKLEQVLLGRTDSRDESNNFKTVTADGLLNQTGFTIGYIDPAIELMYRSNLEFNNITRYQAIKDLAESFDAIVVYNTVAKTASFYPQDNTLTTAWQNNGLIIKYGTYLKSITKEIDASKIITSAKALGKDNLTISLITPDGSDSWEDFSYYLDDYYVEYDKNNLLNMTYNSTTGIAFLSFPIGTSSRWMDAAEALKVAQWQYARDYFHDILLGNLDPTITQHDQYFDLYNIRSKEINKFVADESEFIAWRAKQYTYKYLYDYYYNLNKNGDSSAATIERLAYYGDLWEDSKADITSKEAELEADRKKLFDDTVSGSIANKLSQIRGFLDKAKWSINNTKLQAFIRQSVMTDNKLDNDLDLLEATITHVNENKVPKVTLKINIVDILAAQEAYQDWDKLQAGDLINIYFDDFNIDLVAQIKELSIDFEQHTLDVTISTVHNYNMGYGRYVSKTLRRLYNSDTNITKHLEDGNRISNEESRETYQQLTDGTIKADNAQITFGATDTTGTQSTSFSGTGGASLVIDVVDPVVETIVFSNNKGVSIGDGVIRTYYNRGSGSFTTEVEISGANGFVIRNINNDTNAITKVAYIDETTGAALFAGWALDPGQFSSGSGASFVGINSETPTTGNSTYAFWAGNGTASAAPFSVTKAGDIKATSGSIAGLSVGTGYTTTSDKTSLINPKNAIFKRGAGGAGVWGENETAFYLDEDGRFSLSNELTWNPSTNTFFVNGTIEATIGEIGGWTVAANKLHAGVTNTYVELNADSSSDYAIFAGNQTAASAPFSVQKNGTIISTQGVIGGWSINSTRLSKAYDAGLDNDVNIYAGQLPAAISVLGAGEFGFAIENTNPSEDYPFVLAMTNKGFYVFTDTDAVNNNANPVSAMEITYDEDYIWAKGMLISDNKDILNANVAIGTLAVTDGSASNWGLVVSNGTLTNGSTITIDKDGIEIIKTESSISTPTFSVDTSGNVFVKGDLTASTGTFGTVSANKGNVLLGGSDPFVVRNNETPIMTLNNAGVLTVAGFTASSSAFFSGTKSTFASNDAGVYLASDGIALGANSPFKVTNAGVLTASSGTVGGWTLDTTHFQSNNYAYTSGNFSTAGIKFNNNGTIIGKQFAIDSNGNAFFAGDISAATGTFGSSISIGTGNTIFKANSTEGIYLGNASVESAPFSVALNGTLKATLGKIANWTIGTNKLSAGAIEIDATSGTEKIKVGSTITLDSATGVLTATGANIGGTINATSGTFSGVTISGQLTMGTSGSISIASNAVLLNNSGISSSNNAFKLNTDGTGVLGGFTYGSNYLQAGGNGQKLLLYYDSTNPFLSIGQAINGYNQTGIFLGLDSTIPKLSLVSSGSAGFLRYSPGSTFDLEVGGNAKIGPLFAGNADGSITNYNTVNQGLIYSSGQTSTLSISGHSVTLNINLSIQPLEIIGAGISINSGSPSFSINFYTELNAGGSIIKTLSTDAGSGTFNFPLEYRLRNAKSIRVTMFGSGNASISTINIAAFKPVLSTGEFYVGSGGDTKMVKLSFSRETAPSQDKLVITTQGTGSNDRVITLTTPTSPINANRVVRLPDTDGTIIVSPLIYSAETLVVNSTTFVQRISSGTLDANSTYLVTVAGGFNYTHTGTNPAVYAGIFFSNTNNSPTISGVFNIGGSTTPNTGGINTVSTLTSGSTGSFLSINATANITNGGLFFQGIITTGGSTKQIFLGIRVGISGASISLTANSRLIIQKID
jgi:hypothetical protein